VGEIADMMLEGDLCAGCGVYLEGDGEGFPRYCSKQCEPQDGPLRAPAEKVKCPTCGKRVKAVGLKDHQRDAHGWAGSVPTTDGFGN
jgi:endogenous inhibitor of DNA gyrase (YacG/DUF329 family)